MTKCPGFSVWFAINLDYIRTIYEEIYAVILTQSMGCLQLSSCGLQLVQNIDVIINPIENIYFAAETRPPHFQFTKYFSLLILFSDEYFDLSSDAQADHKNWRKTKELYHSEFQRILNKYEAGIRRGSIGMFL
jgi:hypothetical protein